MMRERFIKFVEESSLPFAAVCARFGISRKTGYKWLNRFREEGPAGLIERDRAPRRHGGRVAPEVEAAVAAVAAEYPQWGSARIRTELQRRGIEPLPAVSTVDAIRRRQAEQASVSGAGRLQPNDSWRVVAGPITVAHGLNHRAWLVRDEATRFVVAADIVAEEGEEGVRGLIMAALERQGMPRRIFWPIADMEETGSARAHTPLTVELMGLGVRVDLFTMEPASTRSDAEAWLNLQRRLRKLPAGANLTGLGAQRPVGPEDVLLRQHREGLARWRGRLAAWVDRCNAAPERLTGAGSSPAMLYRPSPRPLPDIPRDESTTGTDESDTCRRVSDKGMVHYAGRRWLLGRAFGGRMVEVKALPEADHMAVAFGGQALGWIDLTEEELGVGSATRVRALDEE